MKNQNYTAQIITLQVSLIVAFVIAITFFAPSAAFAIDDVKDCVNPEHYGVKRAADIGGKEHKGEKSDSCYSKEDRDKQVKKEYETWKKAVKAANNEYTKKYNAYEKTLHEETEIKAQIEAQDKVIAEKQAQYEKALAVAYKQNYQGQILASIILSGNLSETMNLKKYMDSTLEYVMTINAELKEERQKKQDALDEVESHIQKAKEELIEAATKINDAIPNTSQELRDYIDSHGTEDFTGGRKLVSEDLSKDYLIDVALYYVGTPYVWGGKSVTGADCSGFTSMVYRKAIKEEIGSNTTAQYEKLEHIKLNKLERGDVLFMENLKDASQEHVGIFLEGNTYIHNSGTGTVACVDSNISYFTCGLRIKS